MAAAEAFADSIRRAASRSQLVDPGLPILILTNGHQRDLLGQIRDDMLAEAGGQLDSILPVYEAARQAMDADQTTPQATLGRLWVSVHYASDVAVVDHLAKAQASPPKAKRETPKTRRDDQSFPTISPRLELPGAPTAQVVGKNGILIEMTIYQGVVKMGGSARSVVYDSADPEQRISAVMSVLGAAHDDPGARSLRGYLSRAFHWEMAGLRKRIDKLLGKP